MRSLDRAESTSASSLSRLLWSLGRSPVGRVSSTVPSVSSVSVGSRGGHMQHTVTSAHECVPGSHRPDDGARAMRTLSTHQSGLGTLSVPDVHQPGTEFRTDVL